MLSELRRVCQREHIDAVMTMGDYTSIGATDRIEDAVMVMDGIINDTIGGRDIPIFGVPGNHDVSKADAVEFGDVGKFKHLVDAFGKYRWRPTPTQSFVRYEVAGADGASLTAYLLNSSVGSWSKSLYPEGMRSSIFESDASSEPLKLVDEHLFGDSLPKANSVDTLLTQVYEQLDTPYFRAVDLNDIATQLSEARKATLVVSHHNLLPQYTPRVSYFGEVLNAGYARQAFLQSGADVIYLHGHIHDDPIEIVTSPEPGTGKIFMIAAPALPSGFNKITTFFTADKRPFLIKVTFFRVDRSGRVISGNTAMSRLIPLIVRPEDLLRKDVHRLWKYITQELPESDRGIFSWDELVEHGRHVNVSEAEVEAVVLALHCAGFIEIHNFSESFESWRVEIRK
ncbi:hypothetical protein ATE62_04255 [Sphingopyxis sp. HIX]|nr:hypothetical protein ATE62_04255 [Sphingopyxis sp. HIX]KTE85241.1 hypothetical protein ATE72_05110 [Sphingopyxis sp. HXXIV]